MRSLADRIESYLKVLIERSDNDEVEIQRIELAETFRCAPSQITYVLGTRFTLDEGFITESKRGGRGFIKIRKIPAEEKAARPGIAQVQAENIIRELEATGFLTSREAQLLQAIINREVLDLPTNERDYIRYQIMKTVINLMEG
ncbi:MAG: CtsR family transcriptional regulator [Syntrophomonadales bacterium]|jgi:transcriptional regulator CtsR